jgi:hypothetical protein
MRNLRLVLALTAIACLLGVGATSAYASNEFESKFTTKIVGKQIGTEEFTVYPMTVSCNKSTTKGETPVGKKTSFVITTTYSVCTTLANAIKASVSPAEWEYLAEKEENGKPEGAIKLLNEVTIKPSIGTGCTYKIPPQETKPKESVIYEDGFLAPTGSGNFKTEGQEKLNAYSKYSGLEYEAVGWPCTGPKSAEELKEQKTETSSGEGGKFIGGQKIELSGGSITWIHH